MADRTVGQCIDQTGHAAVGGQPVVNRRTPQTGGMHHRRHVQQQIGGTAASGMDSQSVAYRSVGQDIAKSQFTFGKPHQRPGAAPCHVEPNRLTAGRECGVGQCQTERLGNYLACGGRPQELAPTTGTAASPAAKLGGRRQSYFAVRIACAERLHSAGILGPFGRQSYSTRNEHAGQVDHAGQGQHHRRQSLIAGGHAQDAAPAWKGADEPAQHDGGVVAIGQTVEHARGPLRASIAGIGATAGKWDGSQAFQFFRRRPHEKSDFPMTGVIAQGNRTAIVGAQTARGAEDQELRTEHFARRPAHAGVLRQPEQITAGPGAQHLVVERQRPRRAGSTGGHLIQPWIGCIENVDHFSG
jgi:hypothetical protein